MSFIKNLTNFGGAKPVAGWKEEADARKITRSDFNSDLGWGIAATAGITAIGMVLDEVFDPAQVKVVYQPSIDSQPKEVLLNGGKAQLSTAKGHAVQPNAIIVDGKASGPWSLDTPSTTNDVYLNQAMLRGVVGLKIRRTSEDQGDHTHALHTYQLQLLGSKDENGPIEYDNIVGTIIFGPYSDNVNNLSEGAFVKNDKFPNVHFFNSRGEPTRYMKDGDLEDFVLKGKDIVAPFAATPARFDENAEVAPQNFPISDLLEPYLTERARYKEEVAQVGEEHVSTYKHFETNIGNTLSSQSLAAIAKKAGAQQIIEQSKGR